VCDTDDHAEGNDDKEKECSSEHGEKMTAFSRAGNAEKNGSEGQGAVTSFEIQNSEFQIELLPCPRASAPSTSPQFFASSMTSGSLEGIP
jgi:hypothetical protein